MGLLLSLLPINNIGSQDNSETGTNPLFSILKSAITIAPVGVAAYFGFRQVQANKSLNPISAAGFNRAGGTIAKVGRKIGKTLKAHDEVRLKTQLRSADKLVKSILEGDELNKLFSTIESHNAVVQSLIDAFEDPGAGLDKGMLMNYREQLLEIVQNTVKGDEAKEIVRGIVKSLTDSMSQEARVRWSHNLNENKKIGAQIIAPGPALEPNEPFEVVQPSSLRGAARDRYERLQNYYGKKVTSNFEVVRGKGNLSNQYYVRAFRGGRERKTFLGLLPLTLGPEAAGEVPAYQPIRMGSRLETGYNLNNRFVIDARKAKDVLAGASKAGVSFDDLVRQAAMPIEDIFIEEFMQRTTLKGGRLFIQDKRKFGEFQRQFLNVSERVLSTGEVYGDVNSNILKHLRKVASLKHNTAMIIGLGGMKEEEARELALRIATLPGADIGISAERMQGQLLSGEPFYTVGVSKGSALSAIRPIGAATRGYFPGTARIEQMVGRTTMFLGSTLRTGKLGKSPFWAGGTASGDMPPDIFNMSRNVDWSEAVTGATNKAVILHFGKTKIAEGLGKTGAAYSTGKETTLKFFTKPLLDPNRHKTPSSKFLEWIKGRTTPGQYIELTREEAYQQFGRFMGQGPAGRQFLPDDPTITKYMLTYGVRETERGQMIDVYGQYVREQEAYKGFSPLHKGMVQRVEEAALRRSGGTYAIEELGRLGIPLEHTIWAPGDLLKKAPGFLELQLKSAYAAIVGGEDFENVLQGYAAKQQYSVLGESKLGRSVGAVIRGLAGSKATETQVGMALAGVYAVGGTYTGPAGAESITREQLRGAVKQAFGARAGQVMRVAARGRALGLTSMVAGMGPGDYGAARGSVEQRFISGLQQRLAMMGIPLEEAGDIIAGLYKRKIGGIQTIKAALQLESMTRSMHGMGTTSDYISQISKNVPRLTISDIGALQEDIRELLTKYKSGFILDLTAGVKTPAQRALAASAEEVFGQGEIFMPGSAVLEALKGTTIKTGEGPETIESFFARRTQAFFEDLATLARSVTQARGEATRVFQEFKKDIAGITAKVVTNTLRGKVSGMSYIVGAAYDIEKGTTFGTKAEADFAKQIFERTKGTAVFFDDQAFATFLKDYMGDGNVSKAARMAENFFLGKEGITSVVSRHPMLGPGHVDIATIFRDVRSLFAAGKPKASTDLLSDFLTKTEIGREWATRENIKGWETIKNWLTAAGPNPEDNQRIKRRAKSFFRDFVSNIDSFTGTGGGVAMMPRMTEEIDTSVGKLTIDKGFMAQAFGDLDGDPYQFIALEKAAKTKVLSSLGTAEYQEATRSFKIRQALFEKQAKAGLEQHAMEQEELKIGRPHTDEERRIALEKWNESIEKMREDYLKEAGSKAKIGPLDVRLTTLRMAIASIEPKSKEEAMAFRETIAMLTAIEEHTSIKGKNLPIFRPMAERLTTAIDLLLRGDSELLENVLGREVFRGQQIATDTGVVIAGEKEKVTLSRIVKTIRNAVEQTGAEELITSITEGRLASAMERDSEIMNNLMAGVTPAGAAMRGFQGPTTQSAAASVSNWFNNITNAVSRADSKMMGLAAAGLAGSFVVGSMISSRGYAPEPLTVPGETINPRVRDEIAAGSLFSNQQVGPVPGDLAYRPNNYVDMTGKPINIPQAYMPYPNSYQIRGQVQSEAGLGSMSSFFRNATGGVGFGSVRITDDRRPITSNYLDRLTGF